MKQKTHHFFPKAELNKLGEGAALGPTVVVFQVGQVGCQVA